MASNPDQLYPMRLENQKKDQANQNPNAPPNTALPPGAFQGKPPAPGYPPQAPTGYPPQGQPPQGAPGFPPQGQTQGYPPQGYPPQGQPPQGYPPQGYPPQGQPPQGYPPQGQPPQGQPPQGQPPQGAPGFAPQGQPSQGAYPQGGQGGYPPQGPPGSYPPLQGAPQGGFPPPRGPTGYPPQQYPPQQYPPQYPPQQYPPQQYPPQQYPPQQYPPQQYPLQQYPPQSGHPGYPPGGNYGYPPAGYPPPGQYPPFYPQPGQHGAQPPVGNKFFASLNAHLRRDYTVIIDKSGSMELGVRSDYLGHQPSRWDEARKAIAMLAPYVVSADPDGITIYFFSHQTNNHPKYRGITTENQVNKLFTEVRPDGGTDLAGVLNQAINDHVANGNRPETILVITDGVPDDKESVINTLISATHRIYSDPELSITFIQVGDDPNATIFLQELDDRLVSRGARFDIVDKVTCTDARGMSFAQLVQKSLFD